MHIVKGETETGGAGKGDKEEARVKGVEEGEEESGEEESGEEKETIDEWDTGTERELAKDCSFCDYNASIVITDKVLSVIYRLCEIIKEEWQILLIGTDDGHTVHITDYYVPEQEYGGAHVHQKECVNAAMIAELKIVAGIHSHSTFEPYFSSTDEVTNNSLIRNHIVVNNKHKFVATKRVDLPCGMKKFVNATVVRDLPQLPKIKKIKGFKKMERTSYVYKAPTYGGAGKKWKGGYSKPLVQEPMGYGSLDALPGKRATHAFGEVY